MAKNSTSPAPDGADPAALVIKSVADTAPPDAVAEPPPAPVDVAVLVEVAVLVDHLDYKVDQVIELSADEAAVAAAAGWADPDPAAVAFAKRQRAQV